MFVSLNGIRVPLKVGRWSATKVIEAGMDTTHQALVDLVASSGMESAAESLGVDAESLRERLDKAKDQVATEKLLTKHDVAILDMIDELGYSDDATALILKLPLRKVRARYWHTKRKLRGKRHDEILRAGIPQISQRDFAAFEMHVVLGYSTGKTARMLGLNRGHMVRRINRVREILKLYVQMDPPDIKT